MASYAVAMTTQNADSTDATGSPPTLSWLSFSAALVAVLAIFFFMNPIWEARTTDEVDQNIWFSYVPIPLLVWGLLAWERKLSWPAWFLETTKLTLVKFGITYVVAGSLWSFGGAPTKPIEPRTEAPVGVTEDLFVLQPPPAASELDPDTLGSLELRVLRADGGPVEGALVYVSEGLERLRFDVSPEAYELRHEGESFAPGPHLVSAFRELALIGDARDLHTAEFRDASGKALLNRSLIAGGERRLMFPHEYGVLSLHCRVHDATEPSVALAVFAHPFVGLTDADGRVQFDGVPSGPLKLMTQDLEADEASVAPLPEPRAIELSAGDVLAVDLTLP
ncbi:MAG: hypothetical protein DHS20C15_29880 [Planctomycetota bacterium]|nr:MAG: hypothetical protein DHS20C15_29880 [Planctomycetota bacterium]